MNQEDCPSSRGRALRVCSFIVLAVALLFTIFATYHILRSRAGFLKLFQDFGTQPPLAWLVLSCWYPWLLPVLGGISIGKEWLVKNRYVTLICNGVHLTVVIILWQVYVDGVFQPLLRLIENLAGGRAT